MRKWISIALLGIVSCGGGGGGDNKKNKDDKPVNPAEVVVNNPGAGGALALKDVKFWAYQIQNHYANPQALVDSHYDMLVVDQARSISDMTDYDDATLVAKFKASANRLGGNKLVLAYIDIGEAEDYRWYWQPGWKVGSPSFIVGVDPDGWTGNYPVVFWDPAWKQIVFQYVDRIVADGFDGIYLDWLEAYDFEPVQQKAAEQARDPRAEMAKFVKEIAARGREQKAGFLVIGQNAPDLVNEPVYVAAIDAQAQEHVWFRGQTGGAPGDIPIPATGDWSTEYYQTRLALFQAAGKPVFTVDYAVNPSNVGFCYEKAVKEGYVEYVTEVELNVLTSTPPPGY